MLLAPGSDAAQGAHQRERKPEGQQPDSGERHDGLAKGCVSLHWSVAWGFGSKLNRLERS